MTVADGVSVCEITESSKNTFFKMKLSKWIGNNLIEQKKKALTDKKKKASLKSVNSNFFENAFKK